MNNSKNKTKGIRLSERDLKILRHVRRHRMTTVDILHRSLFPGQGRDAVKSTLRRLCGQPPQYRYLRPEPLDANRVYYRLTTAATRLLGVPKDCARPLGPQARVERYAILWFICGDPPNKRALFNPREFPDQFQFGNHRLPRTNFYVEDSTGDATQLGYILVDHRTHLQRLVRKAGDTMARFLNRGWFDEFMIAESFTLTVLTASERKKERLERILAPELRNRLGTVLRRFKRPESHPLPFAIHVSTVPGLTSIIPSKV